MTPLEMVRQFHEAFGVPAYDTPRIPPKDRRKLRRKLIREEFKELMRALRKNDLIGIADGGADLNVVICGTMLEYGINLDAVLEEVHASNMSKLGADGKPILREDGKVLKGPNYREPNIPEVLFLQRAAQQEKA
jgi:predicted HAD superfamily Cof-like phosphohydrolase